ncbi:arginyl-tRNA--protein transferase 1 isoform X2 [Helianthus annuus]|uniref:arginyl-tRNA--protein transferase 1 isoform X2 n=1 Tax=Helianthus annuus TaxID=4232 RepID=UPI00165304F6|nr:arginyl-tRNA--protein transferase 1 isoform X2 [Helianthus annuus]
MADKMNVKSEASSSSSTIDNGKDESVIDDYGHLKSSCGYCKSRSNTSIAHALLDRGWRRSGCILYKPEMEKTCCPSYTIRLKASDFVPSKEQVRVAKRMQRFLDGSLSIENSDEQKDIMVDNPNRLQSNRIDQMIDYLSDQINSSVLTCIEQGELPSEIQFPKASVKSVAPNKRKLQAEEAQDLVYTCNISFQIAAALRRQAQKNVGTGTDSSLVAEMLSKHLNKLASALSLSVKACNGHVNFYCAETQDVTVGKHVVSHGSSSNNPENFQVKRQNLEIRLKRSTFDREEYELYRKYQIKVHNDTPDHVTESSYTEFLIDSPLIFVQPNGDGTVPSCGFGSFHQQYLVNGKLVAVGVIDILPKCLSSKYLFWDPDLAFLSLGKYSALQEINWVKESQRQCPILQYYYLGYYIHSCNKMRYKAAYRPSELLCPLRYEWVPFDTAKRLLDRKSYVVLSDFAILQNELSLLPNASEDQIEEEETASLIPAKMRKDASNIVIGLRGKHLKYKDIRQAFGPNEQLECRLDKYLTAVGTDLSERMIYSID